METLDQLGEMDIDHRVLNIFRYTLIKEYPPSLHRFVSDVEFHKFFFKGFKDNEVNQQVYEIVSKVCQSDSDPQQISLEKFNNLVSLYQVHPVLKKGHKNESEDVSQILKSANSERERNFERTAQTAKSTPVPNFCGEREYDQVLWDERV